MADEFIDLFLSMEPMDFIMALTALREDYPEAFSQLCILVDEAKAA